MFRFSDEVEVVEMDAAAEVFRGALLLLIRPRVTNGWGFFGSWVLIDLEMLQLADETPEVLFAFLCPILTSPQYFFFNSLELKAILSSVVFS